MKTLAIIDDELEMADLYEIMLETPIQGGQLQLKFFADAREFVSWLDNNSPDLVLCDLNMPHISGIEIAQMLRQKNASTPVYFVSGYEPEDYEEIMKELGITQFLAKPLDYDQVLNSINSELGL